MSAKRKAEEETEAVKKTKATTEEVEGEEDLGEEEEDLGEEDEEDVVEEEEDLGIFTCYTVATRLTDVSGNRMAISSPVTEWLVPTIRLLDISSGNRMARLCDYTCYVPTIWLPDKMSGN